MMGRNRQSRRKDGLGKGEDEFSKKYVFCDLNIHPGGDVREAV